MINNTLINMAALAMRVVIASITQPAQEDLQLGYKIEREIRLVGADTNVKDVLALIEVESCFNHRARKGKFVGILQLGPSYMKESGYPYYFAQTEDGSIKAFVAIQKKYEKLLSGPPESVAIFHKGGPRTLRTYLFFFATGIGRDQALEKTMGVHKNIGDLKGFVKRWEAAKNNKGWWCK